MPDVINLNKARKERKRAEDKKLAAENRERFGRTKAQRRQDRAETHRAETELDGKKLD